MSIERACGNIYTMLPSFNTVAKIVDSISYLGKSVISLCVEFPSGQPLKKYKTIVSFTNLVFRIKEVPGYFKKITKTSKSNYTKLSPIEKKLKITSLSLQITDVLLKVSRVFQDFKFFVIPFSIPLTAGVIQTTMSVADIGLSIFKLVKKGKKLEKVKEKIEYWKKAQFKEIRNNKRTSLNIKVSHNKVGAAEKLKKWEGMTSVDLTKFNDFKSKKLEKHRFKEFNLEREKFSAKISIGTNTILAIVGIASIVLAAISVAVPPVGIVISAVCLGLTVHYIGNKIFIYFNPNPNKEIKSVSVNELLTTKTT